MNDRKHGKHLTIIGGGAGGLAVGYFARKKNIPFTIHEAAEQAGGNCITIRYQDFSFDSGAHRFHDKIPDITAEVMDFMGDDLMKVDIPSQIYYKRKLIDFPLSPLNLLKNLGLFTFIKAAWEVINARLLKKKSIQNFENFAVYTYGKTIAKLFLLNYSEKLWGAPCSKLSPNISGARMKGLDIKTFFKEAVLGSKAKTEHLDGLFYYPKKNGFGAIANNIEEFCGHNRIKTNSRITKILHDQNIIKAIESNKRDIIEVDRVVSTLPISYFLQIMEPAPPEEILGLSKDLKFRNVLLVAVFLNTDYVTRAATVYFPHSDFPFTRLYEPKNRNVNMSPPGKTSVVLEIPCQPEDSIWSTADKELTDQMVSHLIETGLIRKEQIIDATVSRMNYAYPVLEVGFEERVQKIFTYLSNFKNLRISGRNGKFLYTHVHDMLKFGKEIIEEYPFAQ